MKRVRRTDTHQKILLAPVPGSTDAVFVRIFYKIGKNNKDGMILDCSIKNRSFLSLLLIYAPAPTWGYL